MKMICDKNRKNYTVVALKIDKMENISMLQLMSYGGIVSLNKIRKKK
jgi:hypothetical protein